MMQSVYDKLVGSIEDKRDVDVFTSIVSTNFNFEHVGEILRSDFQVLLPSLGAELENITFSEELVKFFVEKFLTMCVMSEFSGVKQIVYKTKNFTFDFHVPFLSVSPTLAFNCLKASTNVERIGVGFVDSWVRNVCRLLKLQTLSILDLIRMKRSYDLIPCLRSWLLFETSTSCVVYSDRGKMNFYQVYLDNLICLITEVYRRNPPVTFVCPIVEFNGDPGVGKTVAVKAVAKLFSEIFDMDYEDSLYVRPDEKFWNNYSQNPVVLYDDVNQTKKLNYNLGKELIDVGGGVMNSVPMAGVAEKGMSFSSILAICTTNVKLTKSLDVVEGALDRRMITLNVTRVSDGVNGLRFRQTGGKYCLIDGSNTIRVLVAKLFANFLHRTRSLIGSERTDNYSCPTLDVPVVEMVKDCVFKDHLTTAVYDPIVLISSSDLKLEIPVRYHSPESKNFGVHVLRKFEPVDVDVSFYYVKKSFTSHYKKYVDVNLAQLDQKSMTFELIDEVTMLFEIERIYKERYMSITRSEGSLMSLMAA